MKDMIIQASGSVTGPSKHSVQNRSLHTHIVSHVCHLPSYPPLFPLKSDYDALLHNPVGDGATYHLGAVSTPLRCVQRAS